MTVNFFKPKLRFAIFALAIFVGLLIAFRFLNLKVGGLENKYRCGQDNQSIRDRCWQDLLDSALKDKGIEGALDTVAQIYDLDKSFADPCHGLVHKVGAAAYDKFSLGQQFKMSPKASYCSYGFYHGFMDELLKVTGDIKKASDFCDYIDQQIKTQTPDASNNCYHGIGHGAVNADDKPDIWGNEAKIVGRAMDVCKRVSNEDKKIVDCVTGVFNGLGQFYVERKYGLSVKKEDPLWFCREVGREYRPICYWHLSRAIVPLTADMSFAKRVDFVVNLYPKLPEAYLPAIGFLAYSEASKSKLDLAKTASDCHSLGEEFRLPCIQGFAIGLFQQGRPNKEYIQAVNFCSMLVLDSEQEGCFDSVFQNIKIRYPVDKVKSICSGLKSNFRSRCLE